MEAANVTAAPGGLVAGMVLNQLHWIDYLVFAVNLVVSALIGVVFGYFDKEKHSTEEFLLAGKSMTSFPVAMSLIASFMSGITLLGTPSEVYQYGFIYWLIGFSYILVMPATSYLYLPVFYKLQFTSVYEYLEYRFSRPVRWFGSFTFSVQMLLYMAIVVYAPALALGQVTGLNVYVSVCLICFVCMFYTTLGGMKAVLWSNAVQTVIMFVSMMLVIFKGAVDLGGIQYVWDKGMESGRATLVDWDPNPATRHTFWTLVFGGYFTWVAIYGVNQAQVQRYLSCQTEKMARNALWINLVGLLVLMMTCSFGGMVVYAKYANCDPVRAGVVSKGDQLFPLFVMDTLGHWWGLPGLFIAGIFSGALSTVASGMSSMAAIVLEDIVRTGCNPNMSEKMATWISRALTFAFGLVTFALVFVAEQMGNILAAALSIFGLVGGPLLGVFTLGMFFPWANAKGALVGSVTSLVLMFWIGIGAQVSLATGSLVYERRPTSIEGCIGFNITEEVTASTLPPDDLEGPLGLYRLSYMWYSATGCITVIVVGMLVTLLTGKQDMTKLDPACITPVVLKLKKWLPGLEGLRELPPDAAELQDMCTDLNAVKPKTPSAENTV